MKHFCTLFATLLFITSYSQNLKLYVRDSAWISMSKKNIIELDNPTVDSAHGHTGLPFAGFLIKDVRADCSYIGVKINSNALSKSKTYEKVELKKGASVALMKYLNNNPNFWFNKTAAATLTCFLKKLRITEVDSVNKTTNYKELYRKLSFEAEGYIGKVNLYYPALRLDTVAVSFAVDKKDFSILTDVLNAFAAKAALVDTEKIFTRNAYTPADLEKRYQQKFHKPILQAQQLSRGVYKTFDEFINNNPSVKQYEFKYDKKAAVLYTSSDSNNWFPERKAFGFCDGRVIWINVNNVFYPLVRQGSTFEFLAVFRESSNYPHIVTGTTPLATLGGSLIATAISNAVIDDPSTKVVYQLNIENGEYY